MKDGFKISRVFNTDRKTLFNYWIHPDLLEKWAAPDEMTLKVPYMDARSGGEYRFEHSVKDGRYVCEGHFKEYDMHERLVQVDTAHDPSGTKVFQDLECITSFRDVAEGTEVTIEQKNFSDGKVMEDCKKGWQQCLDKLENLILKQEGHAKEQSYEDRPNI